MSKLILVRHGQSEWNRLDIFTGWIDIPLSKEGMEEAVSVGKKMADLSVDEIYVSSLIRSQTTAFIAMAETRTGKIPCMEHGKDEEHGEWYDTAEEEAKRSLIPVHVAWELNERMYGKLQGLNKGETRERYGAGQVLLWRRSFRVAPPDGESLAMTAERAVPFFCGRILDRLKAGKDLFVCAHGNSLRAIVMHIEKMSEEEVLHFEWPTGEPRMYEYANGSFERVPL